MIRTIRRVLLIIISSGVVLLLVALAVLHLGADTWLVNALVRSLIPGATPRWLMWPATTSQESSSAEFGLSGTITSSLAAIRYAPPIDQELLSDGIRIRRVEVSDPLVNLRQSSGGSWNPFPLGKPKSRQRRSRPAPRSSSSSSP